jgi:hypothetical protein
MAAALIFPARAAIIFQLPAVRSPSLDFASRRSLTCVPVGVVEFWFDRLVVDLAGVVEPFLRSSCRLSSFVIASCVQQRR